MFTVVDSSKKLISGNSLNTVLNFQHGSDCAASHFSHDGCELASKFQAGSGCIMNSRCAASQFLHDSGSASTQFLHGSGCFKNVDGMKTKDGRCIDLNPAQ